MSKLIHILIFLLCFATACVEAVPTTNYVNALGVGTGNNSGTDWNNAITNFTGAAGAWADYTYGVQDLTGPQGASYWLCDRQGAKFFAATSSNHGTDVGWNPAWDGIQVRFKNISRQSDNIIFDGGRGDGQPGDPWYVPYHLICSSTNMGDGFYLMSVGQGGGTFDTNNVTVHIEFTDLNTTGATVPPWNQNYSALQFIGSPPYGSNYVAHCYFHHLAGVAWHGSGPTVYEDCAAGDTGEAQFAMNFGPSTDHSEIGYFNFDADGTVIRNCEFFDWRSTGGLVFLRINGLYIYGNTITTTSYWAVNPGDADGFIDLLNSDVGPWKNIYIVHNTFAFGRWGAKIAMQAPGTNVTIANNIFLSFTNFSSGPLALGPAASSIGGSNDYNSFRDVGLTLPFGEAHEEDLSSVPFISPTDFRLLSNTAAPDPIVDNALPTKQDRFGNTYLTSRGAFEFTNIPSPWGIQIK